MIPRYAKPEMESIWTDDNKFKIMLEVEILASEAMSKLGVVPKAAIAKVRKKAKINKFSIIIPKSFCMTKESINKMKKELLYERKCL